MVALQEFPFLFAGFKVFEVPDAHCLYRRYAIYGAQRFFGCFENLFRTA